MFELNHFTKTFWVIDNVFFWKALKDISKIY